MLPKSEKTLEKLISDYQAARLIYLEECTGLGVDPDPALLGVEFFNGTADSIREAILMSVSITEPTSVTSIFDRAKSMGVECLDISIRNEISKLKKEGLLVPVGHGSYLKAKAAKEVVNAR